MQRVDSAGLQCHLKDTGKAFYWTVSTIYGISDGTATSKRHKELFDRNKNKSQGI